MATKSNKNTPKVAERQIDAQTFERYRKMAESVPQYLYKYRADDKGTDSIFSENTIYFSPPVNFNDPFDCQLVTNTDNTRQEMEDFVLSTNPQLKTKSKWLKQLVDASFNNPKEWDKIVNESIIGVMNETGVSCFSEKKDELLMWSHYANSHKGLCLKFDTRQDNDLFDAVLGVNYSSSYPVYNHLRDGDSIMDVLLSTKSIHWEYEKEWRVIKPRRIGAHNFKRSSLIEVIFGCKADNSFINKIRTLARGAGMNHITYTKAKVSKSSFALTFDNLQ